jgi:hypothetical protein
MLVDSHNKRPKLVALTMRFVLLASPIVANTIEWHALSHEPLDIFRRSPSFMETFTKPSHGDRCGIERSSDKNWTDRQTTSRKSPSLCPRTSLALILASTSKRFKEDNVEEHQHDTIGEKNAEEDSSWPKICVDDVRWCHLPIQQDPMALFSPNRNKTTVSNITADVELEVDRMLRRENEVDPVLEFQKENIWSLFAFVDALI